jgi:hypothetical protein
MPSPAKDLLIRPPAPAEWVPRWIRDDNRRSYHPIRFNANFHGYFGVAEVVCRTA